MAVAPEDRGAYAAVLKRLVRPGGRVLFVSVEHPPFEGGKLGPPHSIERAEVSVCGSPVCRGCGNLQSFLGVRDPVGPWEPACRRAGALRRKREKIRACPRFCLPHGLKREHRMPLVVLAARLLPGFDTLPARGHSPVCDAAGR